MHPRDPNPPQSFAGMQRVYLEAVEIDNTDTKKKKIHKINKTKAATLKR